MITFSMTEKMSMWVSVFMLCFMWVSMLKCYLTLGAIMTVCELYLWKSKLVVKWFKFVTPTSPDGAQGLF